MKNIIVALSLAAAFGLGALTFHQRNQLIETRQKLEAAERSWKATETNCRNAARPDEKHLPD